MTKEEERNSFLLVGVGASAGGIEPLRSFFDNVPSDCNMSFVVIQHFDPKHHSVMDNILEQHTSLQVTFIRQDETVERNRVYLKPSDQDVVLEGERFKLLDPPEDVPLHTPIDTFFRSLAEQRGEHGACVVLSGSGSDGTFGIEAVKGAGGFTVAQDRDQADYRSMPNSAIDTGMVDLVLKVEKIPSALVRFAKFPYFITEPKEREEKRREEDEVDSILTVVRKQTGHDFSRYKRSTIERRIARRLLINRIDSKADYIGYLRESPGEVWRLFNDLTVTVTGFFRDPKAYNALENLLRERILKPKRAGEEVRAWVIGCSTGEEAYSIAMLFAEAEEALRKNFKIKIFATDINRLALGTARAGVYPPEIRTIVPENYLEKYFLRREDGYQVTDRIRQMVIFANHNIIRDPPFSQTDLVCCRNLLIYMEDSLQHKVRSLVHYSLKAGGLLFLGSAEGLSKIHELFTPIDAIQKIFAAKKTDQKAPVSHVNFESKENAPHTKGAEVAGHRMRPEERVPASPSRHVVEKVMMEKYAPPAILVDNEFRVLFIHGDADRFLRPPRGEPDFNILKMARKEIYISLQKALEEAQSEKHEVAAGGIQISYGNQHLKAELTVTPFSDDRVEYLLVSFVQKEEYSQSQRDPESGRSESNTDVEHLRSELQAVKEDLQSTIEELETSNEELKSANEELQASNEELQSANEELESSQEEMQSVNEELETVNAELQEKNQRLARMNDDFENLFSTLSAGSVFLDLELRIKRFTPAAQRVFKLLDKDKGRLLEDFANNIENVNILSEAAEVLDTLKQKQLEIRTSNDEYFETDIHVFRSSENIIDGVVITFHDVTHYKRLEVEARNAQILMENIVNTIGEPLLVIDGDLQVQRANRAFLLFFNTTADETEGKLLYQLGNGQWDIPVLRTLLEELIPEKHALEDYPVEHEFPRIGRRKVLLNARRIVHEDASEERVLLTFRDITDVKAEK